MRTQVASDMFSVVLLPLSVRRPDFLGGDVAIVQRGIYDNVESMIPTHPFTNAMSTGHPLRSVVVDCHPKLKIGRYVCVCLVHRIGRGGHHLELAYRD